MRAQGPARSSKAHASREILDSLDKPWNSVICAESSGSNQPTLGASKMGGKSERRRIAVRTVNKALISPLRPAHMQPNPLCFVG
jgi:hypothetical protein